jgi:hypothetical protein
MGNPAYRVDLDGSDIEYIGTLDIEGAEPTSPPAAAMTANTPITDTTGKAATVSMS